MRINRFKTTLLAILAIFTIAATLSSSANAYQDSSQFNGLTESETRSALKSKNIELNVLNDELDILKNRYSASTEELAITGNADLISKSYQIQTINDLSMNENINIKNVTETLRANQLINNVVGEDSDLVSDFEVKSLEAGTIVSEISEKQKTKTQLETEISQLETKIANNDFAAEISLVGNNGTYQVVEACPVQGDHFYVSSFGWPRGNGTRTHQGNDIMAATGVPIVAPADGLVQNRSGGKGGINFGLFGDNGYYFYGAHMDSLAGPLIGTTPYRDKVRVKAGEIIGYNGSTGNAAGGDPHLHFQIHKSDPDNPALSKIYDYLSEVCLGAR